MRKETREDFQKAIEATSSMQEAAKLMGISYDTFRSYARRYGVFNPNQAGKGRMKAKVYRKAEDVFQKFDKQIGRSIVKKWLLQEREYKCQKCSNSGEWQGKPLALELEHVNGDPLDNTRENLILLCPNCHSQTATFRGRKIK
jgi:hypothetical protein